jgi:hypothetical protein
MLYQSHKHQNGPETEYCLEPFCALRKPYECLAREIGATWNTIYDSILLRYRKLEAISSYKPQMDASLDYPSRGSLRQRSSQLKSALPPRPSLGQQERRLHELCPYEE